MDIIIYCYGFGLIYSWKKKKKNFPNIGVRIMSELMYSIRYDINRWNYLILKPWWYSTNNSYMGITTISLCQRHIEYLSQNISNKLVNRVDLSLQNKLFVFLKDFINTPELN